MAGSLMSPGQVGYLVLDEEFDIFDVQAATRERDEAMARKTVDMSAVKGRINPDEVGKSHPNDHHYAGAVNKPHAHPPVQQLLELIVGALFRAGETEIKLEKFEREVVATMPNYVFDIDGATGVLSFKLVEK